jgi:hypothetical protein
VPLEDVADEARPHVQAAVPKMPKRSVPVSSVATDATAARACAAAARVRCACGSSASPASVGTTPRPARVNSGAPTAPLQQPDLLGQRGCA